MTGNATFQVDPAGDLNLLVRHHGQDEIFKVSSKVMSLASPVWRTMLDPNGPFRESKPDNGEVAFPDDEAEAMLIILLAAHLRNQEVPQAIVYQQLLNICVLCDKYDCIGVVRPWISAWEATLKTLADDVGHEEWLFIAWTIGDEKTFERLIRRLAHDAMTDGSGKYLTASGKELRHNMPPGFVDFILDARHEAVIAMITVCYSLVVRYGHDKKQILCSHKQPGCDDMHFGALVRHLQKLKLWPGTPCEIAPTILMSVATLSKSLVFMECHTFPPASRSNNASYYANSDYHDQCGIIVELKTKIENILGAMPLSTRESDRNHMVTQRQKLSQTDMLLSRLQKPGPV